MVTLPANPRLTSSAERKLQVVVMAHGPRRVLSVTDLTVKPPAAWLMLLQATLQHSASSSPELAAACTQQQAAIALPGAAHCVNLGCTELVLGLYPALPLYVWLVQHSTQLACRACSAQDPMLSLPETSSTDFAACQAHGPVAIEADAAVGEAGWEGWSGSSAMLSMPAPMQWAKQKPDWATSLQACLLERLPLLIWAG